ncbi:uncharacterized protein LOC131649396 [Vicia villosa]|uniref:uncharacterized protein LOC131649396 n=1 Tax=Vicia villosa TaxID=3911 RepID=UPI00273AA027|nr:uncharacterized protein LOC131649396 [Vicia villosa]
MNVGTQTVAQIQPTQPQAPAFTCDICGGPHFAIKGDLNNKHKLSIRVNLNNNSTSNNPLSRCPIAQQITNSQAPGALPSATVTNPRDNKIVNAVTTRSAKGAEIPEEEDLPLEVDLELLEDNTPTDEPIVIQPAEQEKVIVPKPISKLPFPQRQKKKGQHEKNFEKFLEMFKKLEINIPFSEALEHMLIYAKFKKDIISKKRTIDTNPILLTETSSAILQGMKIPIKKPDRGSLTISCTIGDRYFKKTLIDLGASVSLMSLSIYKNLT